MSATLDAFRGLVRAAAHSDDGGRDRQPLVDAVKVQTADLDLAEMQRLVSHLVVVVAMSYKLIDDLRGSLERVAGVNGSSVVIDDLIEGGDE